MSKQKRLDRPELREKIYFLEPTTTFSWLAGVKQQ